VPRAELLAKTYDRQDVGSAGEGRKPKPANVYGLVRPTCEGPMRPVELVLPPRAEAVLEDEGLIELHPKTDSPGPPDRQLVLPLVS
jgi:hypothetical protein